MCKRIWTEDRVRTRSCLCCDRILQIALNVEAGSPCAVNIFYVLYRIRRMWSFKIVFQKLVVNCTENPERKQQS